MSVIGRLDDQVEAVLITPLKRERKSDVEERDAPSPPLSPQAPSDAERDAESSGETREANAALPVWLL